MSFGFENVTIEHVMERARIALDQAFEQFGGFSEADGNRFGNGSGATAAAAWTKGDYAYHNSKEAIVIKKYTDGDVTLRYADGAESGYIHPSNLTRSNRSDFDQAVTRAKQREAAAHWTKGDYAYHNSKEAIVIKKYTDGDVTLRYADGAESGYIHPSNLTRSNRSDFDQAVTRAKQREAAARWTKGDYAYYNSKEAVVITKYSDGDVTLRYADGAESGYIHPSKLARSNRSDFDQAVTRAKQREAAAAEQAAREEAARWTKGDYAYYNNKEAVVIKKYSDGDVTLRYADGAESGYIHPSKLARSNRSDFDQAVTRAKQTGSGVGTCVTSHYTINGGTKSSGTDNGKIITAFDCETNKVKIRFDDGVEQTVDYLWITSKLNGGWKIGDKVQSKITYSTIKPGSTGTVLGAYNGADQAMKSTHVLCKFDNMSGNLNINAKTQLSLLGGWQIGEKVQSKITHATITPGSIGTVLGASTSSPNRETHILCKFTEMSGDLNINAKTQLEKPGKTKPQAGWQRYKQGNLHFYKGENLSIQEKTFCRLYKKMMEEKKIEGVLGSWPGDHFPPKANGVPFGGEATRALQLAGLHGMLESILRAREGVISAMWRLQLVTCTLTGDSRTQGGIEFEKWRVHHEYQEGFEAGRNLLTCLTLPVLKAIQELQESPEVAALVGSIENLGSSVFRSIPGAVGEAMAKIDREPTQDLGLQSGSMSKMNMDYKGWLSDLSATEREQVERAMRSLDYQKDWTKNVLRTFEFEKLCKLSDYVKKHGFDNNPDRNGDISPGFYLIILAISRAYDFESMGNTVASNVQGAKFSLGKIKTVDRIYAKCNNGGDYYIVSYPTDTNPLADFMDLEGSGFFDLIDPGSFSAGAASVKVALKI
eukprot:gene1663-16073_t